MLCQNCGRRSSDKLNFCGHCGAVASQPDSRESGMGGITRSSTTLREALPSPPPSARTAPARSTKYRTARPQQRGSSGFSTLVFFAFSFGMVYWLTKTDEFDLITFIRSAIQSELNEPARQTTPDVEPAARTPERLVMPEPAAVPAAAPPPPAASPGTRRANPPASATGDTSSTVGIARRGPPPDIEGLTSAQVEQRLGVPNRRVTGGDGINVWVYQNGSLIVYFYKDRASLKPPR